MNQCLIASIAEQRLYLFSANQDSQALAVESWQISSGRNGAGNLKNSNQTPLGWHLIRAKIGANKPIFSVFRGRRSTGEICDLATADTRKDWILSRILWLSGMQRGTNRLGDCDSMQRYIYIHGTNEENLLGDPVSHGCLRMANTAVIELFSKVENGSPLLITNKAIGSALQQINMEIRLIDSAYPKKKNMLNQLFTAEYLIEFSKRLESAC